MDVLPAETPYDLYHNVDLWPYHDPVTDRWVFGTGLETVAVGFRPGHRMRLAWSGRVDCAVGFDVDCSFDAQVLQAAARVWSTHNLDDRPDWRVQRSMCVGDVVVFPMLETAVAVERVGWRTVAAGEMEVVDL